MPCTGNIQCHEGRFASGQGEQYARANDFIPGEACVVDPSCIELPTTHVDTSEKTAPSLQSAYKMYLSAFGANRTRSSGSAEGSRGLTADTLELREKKERVYLSNSVNGQVLGKFRTVTHTEPAQRQSKHDATLPKQAQLT